MSVAKSVMRLDWKTYNVDIGMLDAAIRAMNTTYCSNQANSCLELWFLEEPSDADRAAILALWDGILPDSEMVTGYRSAAQIKADQSAKKASAIEKLKALGLTDDEVAALIG